MREIISLLLVSFGTIFMLIASIGLVRMPDLYLRMSAATKAATLGAGLTLLAVGVDFGNLSIVSRAAAITVFLLLTAPVAAHMIGRAAYVTNVELWSETQYDELKDRYDEQNDILTSMPFDQDEKK